MKTIFHGHFSYGILSPSLLFECHPQQLFVVPHSSSMKQVLLDKGNRLSKKSAYFRRLIEKRDSLSSPCSSLKESMSPSSHPLSPSSERLSSNTFPPTLLASMVEYSLPNPVHYFKKNELLRNIQWGELGILERVVYYQRSTKQSSLITKSNQVGNMAHPPP
ncbi:unnamed protein product [Trypanosoma congolense IL3000]|uniref:WGS project CAEQ00000000 data, annotated contig 2244 n=1 Tax=Trypanosoma congolense (strain IL3000) TaxID=1068625 RepID=F9WCK9_TRYCI|nr:unnamed protein product [Trypanosoma congolense IL3000]